MTLSSSLFFKRTSRGLDPLAIPTMPKDSNWSISLLALLYPIDKLRCNKPVDPI